MKQTNQIQIITTVNDDLQLTAKKVLLAGEASYASLSANIPPNFIAQAHREASVGLLTQFNKDTKKVFVAIDQYLFDYPKIRFALAFDGYLSWGLRQNGKVPTIIFGGGESENGVNVEILIFVKNQLFELREKILPPSNSIHFRESLTAVLAELRMTYPNARLYQAAPLIDWQIENVEFIGDKPLKTLTYAPLTRALNQKSHYILPGALTVIGLLIYPAMTVTGWTQYSAAVAACDIAMSDPDIKSKVGMDTEFLNVMNIRRVYMDQPRRQTALASKSATIVTGIAAVPNLQIIEMKLPAPGVNQSEQVGLLVNPEVGKRRVQLAADRPADIWVSIAAPKTGEVAIVQAKEVMTAIANATGMSLRLTHQGWRDDGKRRIFNIEGFVHD